MRKQYTEEELLNKIKDCKTIKQLFINLKYSNSVNKKVKLKWYKIYSDIGINVPEYIKKNNKKIYVCKQCSKQFTEKYSKSSSGDFCSLLCARRYSSNINRDNTNKKLKECGKRYSKLYKEKYYKNPKICPICGNIISYEKRNRKTCSYVCGRTLAVKNSTYENCGGYRKGSGRGKHGWYKGIYCDSTYELAYLIYCLDHNIDIKRCDKTFEYKLNGKKHTYHPDFIIDETIIEIKGYDRNDVKVKELSSKGSKYKLLFEKDLIPYFEYVSKTYNKKYRKKWNNFYELYDNYKPKYEYTCDNCGKIFTRDKELKTEHKFCSRSCAGHYIKNNY